ncbi:MAG: hypothetical protein GY795_02775, partial [Desulfobacterales bacterium]|nr:hypothetical protein [Desulfobacterales bacterium]
CGSCGSATCSSVDNGSIDVRMGLGKSEQGNLAGHIVLRAETPDPANASPEALEVLKFGSDTEILYDGTALRQVVSPERFVSIATVGEYKYTVIFYSPDAMGDKVNGFYEIAEGAEPFVSWAVENPDREASLSRLKLTETAGTVQKVYEYMWDEAESTWTLDKGNGLQIIAKKKETVSGSPVETEIVKNASGA